MKYHTGHVDPWWDDSFKQLDYIYYPLKNTWDEERWVNEGYRSSEVGLNLKGALYNNSRPMPDYATPFYTLFDWDHVNIAYYRMNTLDALPLHIDAYTSYRKMLGINDSSIIWRCILFLEDWKSGHYFEIDNTALLNWRAGDYVFWNDSVEHFAGNFGTEPRYTMQITGIKNNQTTRQI